MPIILQTRSCIPKQLYESLPLTIKEQAFINVFYEESVVKLQPKSGKFNPSMRLKQRMRNLDSSPSSLCLI